jgi:hypothetical protein
VVLAANPPSFAVTAAPLTITPSALCNLRTFRSAPPAGCLTESFPRSRRSARCSWCHLLCLISTHFL